MFTLPACSGFIRTLVYFSISNLHENLNVNAQKEAVQYRASGNTGWYFPDDFHYNLMA
jgi:hypothetical protein